LFAGIKDESFGKVLTKKISLLMNFTEKSAEKFVKRQNKKEKVCFCKPSP